MERKNDSTILLLLAAGLGVYWLTRKKTPVDQKSIQPVIEQPSTTENIVDKTTKDVVSHRLDTTDSLSNKADLEEQDFIKQVIAAHDKPQPKP